MEDVYRLVVADSHAIVREAISAKIESACKVQVIDQVSDGYSTLKTCRAHSPDILMMDLSLTRPSGPETLVKIRRSCPETQIIVMSSEATVNNAFMCLSQGAVGFMPKQASGSDFVRSIEAAINGYTYLPVEFLREFVHSRQKMTRTGNIFGLSPREIEVLEASVTGKSAKEVAAELDISVRTVETHRTRIYRKTSCSSFQELSSLI